jgi:hypothetical protein
VGQLRIHLPAGLRAVGMQAGLFVTGELRFHLF